LVGVAVKVTEVPAQMVVAEALMLTLTGRFGFTVIKMVFDVAGFPVAQVALLVRMQETTSLLVRVVVVNVGLLLPTAVAPIYHW
jgi:hypothetical protein